MPESIRVCLENSSMESSDFLPLSNCALSRPIREDNPPASTTPKHSLFKVEELKVKVLKLEVFTAVFTKLVILTA